MIKYIIVMSFLIYSQPIHSQKEDYVWVGGWDRISANEVKNGIEINFNETDPNFNGRAIGYNFRSYSASICDKNGELLFYTNGCVIMNPDGTVMENGDSLNYNEWFVETWNEDCNRGYPGAQSVIVLPSKKDDGVYYIIGQIRIYNGFGQSPSFDLHYSTVSVTGNKVLSKNFPIYEEKDLVSYYLTAISNFDNDGFFIVQPKVNDSIFFTYLLDENGISKLSDQNSSVYLNKEKSSSSGTAKFSPDGTRYALYNYFDGLHIYDFDRETGLFTNHQAITVFDSINANDTRFSSIEWSSNSRFIYTASQLELHQIDTWEENIQEGVRLIDVYDGTLNPFPTTFFLMALGPDCRIYMASTSTNSSYHIINNPDELGTACNFIQNGIELPQSSGSPSFPNHPRWRVDEEDKCDPTIVSVFGNSVYYRSDLNVYPNPSDGHFTVDIPNAEAGKICVTDIFGDILKTEETSSGEFQGTINISDMPTGTYHVEYYPVNNKERKVYTKQVVKID